DNAVMLAAILEDDGHRVRVAFDGPSSLELFEQDPPQLIVLDLGLPSMDGFEVAIEMRKRYGDDFRIVAFTGYCGESVRARAESSGIDSFLTKPFRPTHLRAIVGTSDISTRSIGIVRAKPRVVRAPGEDVGAAVRGLDGESSGADVEREIMR